MEKEGRYRVWLSPQQPREIETAEAEEFVQSVDFLEEPKVYEGFVLRGEFSVVFVDGVRRTECLAYIKDQQTGEGFEGAFVSLGAGALKINYGRTNRIEESLVVKKIERLLIFRGRAQLESFLGFRPYGVEGELSAEVNRYMREELESKVAFRAFKELTPTLLLCDGPLSNKLSNTPCLGLVKNIKKLYMNPSHIDLLYSLRKGQRSPIIKLQQEQEGKEKYTWYVKLSSHEGLYGLVRVELFPQKNEERIRELADLSAGILPLFASQSFQDRRSPQNLLPIGKLEKFLRQHLGAYRLMRRKIEQFFYV